MTTVSIKREYVLTCRDCNFRAALETSVKAEKAAGRHVLDLKFSPTSHVVEIVPVTVICV